MPSRSVFGGLSLLAVGLLAIAGVQAQPAPTYPGITFATYSTTPGALVCKLDVYIPTVGTPPYPVLVYVHGGGWSSGSRTATGYVPIDVLAQGVATVAIDYRLTSQAHQFGMVDGVYVPVTWPAQIHDCKAAIRWVRGNAATYGFDASRIGVFGPSAGGHLVAALGTMGGVTSYTHGGHYSGATTATLTVSNADSGDAANYRCVITAGCGSATSNQAALTVGPRSVPGDFDHDGDVDQEDFAHLQNCLDTTSAPPTVPNCADADLDKDVVGAVSQEDMLLFLGCLTGPGMAGNPNCAN